MHADIKSDRLGADKLLSLLDVLGELGKGSLEQLLLLGRELTKGEDLLDTLSAELDVGRKVLDALGLVEGRLDKGRLDDAGLAVEGSDERVGESSTGVTHGEGGRSGSGLGLDDLVTAELDSVDKGLVLLALDVGALAGLAQERDDGDARVSTDDGDVDVLGVGVLDLAEESRGPDDVEGGDTEESLLVKDTGLLEHLGEDGDGRVDRVGNNQDVGLGRVLGNGLGEVSDDRGVGVLGLARDSVIRAKRRRSKLTKRSSRLRVSTGRPCIRPLTSFRAFGGHQPG